MNLRIGLAPLFFQNFEYAADGFADIVLQLIDRLTLGVAAWEGRDLCPKAAVRIFMDDNGIVLHVSIFSWMGCICTSPIPGRARCPFRGNPHDRIAMSRTWGLDISEAVLRFVPEGIFRGLGLLGRGYAETAGSACIIECARWALSFEYES